MNDQKQPVVITDVRIPFGSMVTLMVKFVLAAIPAMIILFLIIMLLTAFLGAIGVGLSTIGHH